jgi:hypothetical protein
VNFPQVEGPSSGKKEGGLIVASRFHSICAILCLWKPTALRVRWQRVQELIFQSLHLFDYEALEKSCCQGGGDYQDMSLCLLRLLDGNATWVLHVVLFWLTSVYSVEHWAFWTIFLLRQFAASTVPCDAFSNGVNVHHYNEILNFCWQSVDFDSVSSSAGISERDIIVNGCTPFNWISAPTGDVKSDFWSAWSKSLRPLTPFEFICHVVRVTW